MLNKWMLFLTLSVFSQKIYFLSELDADPLVTQLIHFAFIITYRSENPVVFRLTKRFLPSWCKSATDLFFVLLESPERASLNLASNIKPIDGSISNLSFNKPVSTQIDVGNAENPQETGSGAAALTSVTAAECRARVTGSNMEENLVTASSSNGRVSLGK